MFFEKLGMSITDLKSLVTVPPIHHTILHHASNTVFKPEKPFISIGLPEGSVKNIVYYSPISPSKRMVGAMIKSTPKSSNLLASSFHVANSKTTPRWSIATM